VKALLALLKCYQTHLQSQQLFPSTEISYAAALQSLNSQTSTTTTTTTTETDPNGTFVVVGVVVVGSVVVFVDVIFVLRL